MTTPANESGSRVTPKQRRLTEKEIKSAKDAADAIAGIGDWDTTPDGRFFWAHVVESLVNQATNGTSDGKPWVEPELTDKDAQGRTFVMAHTNTSYTLYGPFILIRVRSKGAKYVVESLSGDILMYEHARRATAEEMKDIHDTKLSS